jgi:ribosome-binding factor A
VVVASPAAAPAYAGEPDPYRKPREDDELSDLDDELTDAPDALDGPAR